MHYPRLVTAAFCAALSLPGSAATDPPEAVDHAQTAKRINPQVKGDFQTPACSRYFDRGIWRRDENVKLWSLSLVPSTCARSLSGTPSSTGLVVDTIIRDYSGSEHWGNARGMRHQLVCHLAQFPNKPEWNIEPGRPDVGYEETVRQKCNPWPPAGKK